MSGGYMGRMLFVNLSTGEIREEMLGEELRRDFLGGYGIGARVLYSRMKPKVDPLGPENMIGFITGPLTGTPAITGNRWVVVAKSPLTHTWGDANCGGTFGPALKRSGYDAVFIEGKAEKPVYLYIEDRKVEIRSADEFWGKETWEAEAMLKKHHGGTKPEAALIGPAGERLSLISAVMNDEGRAAGRSGLGAVMGSKKLKAIVAGGTHTIPVANLIEMKRVRKTANKEMIKRPVWKFMSRYGTTGITGGSARSGDSPVRNWGGVGIVDFPDAEPIGAGLVDTFKEKSYGCWQCPIACGAIVEVKDGPYKVRGHKPEYETTGGLGTLLLNDHPESIIYLNDLCNRAGLDVISVAGTVGFAMECYEHGILTQEDLNGLELTWGNHGAIVQLVRDLIERKGIGDLLADGVKVASEKIGQESKPYAIHVHGQELPMHDPRLSPGFATTYMLDATPGRHTQGGSHSIEEGSLKPDLGITQQLADKYSYTGKGKTHKIMSNYTHVVNAAGICLFGDMCSTPADLVQFLREGIGDDFTVENVLKIGERIATLRTAFNVREGIIPMEIKVPARMIGVPPQKVGPLEGVTIDIKTQNEDYLKEMGWDTATGIPTKERLIDLGLADVAEDLHPVK
jgi:aldehyde:ferredoxin oxidoreductase